MTSPKVIVRDLRKRYGVHEAARGVTVDVQDGEIFGLIGPNGAGKTTTIECLLGLRQPDSGTLELCGIDARANPAAVKQRIGAALQTTALQDKITAREALTLFGAFYANPVKPAQLLERFSLVDKADAPFDSLSGGQKQRLALALALVNNPELVFLDEPTAGLDPQSRRELHGEIARMRHDGHTVLLTTHYMDEAEALCDRIAILDRGRIIATGSPQELVNRSSSTQTVSLSVVFPADLAWVRNLPSVTHATVDARRAEFQTSHVTASVAALMTELERQRLEVAELHVQKATLEDVFIEMTRSAESAEVGAPR